MPNNYNMFVSELVIKHIIYKRKWGYKTPKIKPSTTKRLSLLTLGLSS